MNRAPAGGRRRQVDRGRQVPVFLVACEGPTEAQYLSALSRLLRGKAVIRPTSGSSDPQSVVSLAVRERKAYQRRSIEKKDPHDMPDGVWALMDVDVHAHLEEAVKSAERQGIGSAVSCPCFEVWLILHAQYVDRYFDDAQAVKRYWSSLPESQRAVDGLLDLVDEAIERSTRLGAKYDRHTSYKDRNPSTEVGQMVLLILQAAKLDQHHVAQRSGATRR